MILKIFLIAIVFSQAAWAKGPCFLSLYDVLEQENLAENSDRIRVAAVAIIERDGLILLGKRKNGNEEGTWGLAGGKIDPEDSHVLEGALREINEETGIDADESRLKFVQRLGAHEAEDGFLYLRYLYILRLHKDETPRVMEPNKLDGEWQWFEPSHLPEPLFSTDRSLFMQPEFWDGVRSRFGF